MKAKGKIFSKPKDEIEISKDRVCEIRNLLKIKSSLLSIPKLSVKIDSYLKAKALLEVGVDAIYLSGEVYSPNLPFSKSEILKITKNKKSTKIYLCFPKIMTDADFSKYNQLLKDSDLDLDGLVVTSLGAIHKFKSLGLEMVGDYSLNIYNQKAASFYENQGLSIFTLSVETPLLEAQLLNHQFL